LNTTIDLLLKHRSIRKYTEDPIPDEHIRQAVIAGQAASTSSAVQAATILHITRDEDRRALVPLTGGQEKIADCGAFFVVCGDSRRHRLICERDGMPYDARLEAFLLTVVDATLFAQNLVIAFESMGYGICYVGGLRNQLDEVDAVLELPEGVYPLYGLCVGVPAEDPMDRPRLPIDAVLLRDRYPSDADMLEKIDAYDHNYRDYMKKRSGKDRGWSGSMARKFVEPRRAYLAGYYAAKGADLT